MALWTLASGALGEMLSLALNAVGLLACGMVWNAARIFHGRKPMWPGLLFGPVVWIGAVVNLDPGASPLRMTIGAAIIAIYASLTAAELLTELAGAHTVVVVEHDMDFVMKLVDRLVVMNFGSKLVEGVFSIPATCVLMAEKASCLSKC